jgi:putative flavoprotein involved in K+ transport
MYVETAIIGGGFSGLNTALMLQEKGSDYIVLERDTLCNVWKNQRWDGFEFNTPHEFNRFFNQVDDIPDDQCGKDFKKQIKLWEEHVLEHSVNFRENQKVQGLKFIEDGSDGPRFSMEIQPTKNGASSTDEMWTVTARNVICCTGAFNVPTLPPGAEKWPDYLTQMHSIDLKEPEQFPDREKAILVVGSGQSGCQIADYLAKKGKQVWLATGSANGVLRTYRGKHMFYWVKMLGMDTMTTDMLKQMPNAEEVRYFSPPHVGSGAPISYFSLARQGVTILGRFDGIQEQPEVKQSRIIFKDDRIAHVEKAVASYENTGNKIKQWIANQPTEVQATLPPETPETSLPEPEWEPIPELLESNGPLSLPLDDCQGVIWCTGFHSNARTYLPETVTTLDLDERTQAPDHWKSKVHPGLYYIGFPWVRTFSSSVLPGISVDQEFIVNDIVNSTP